MKTNFEPLVSCIIPVYNAEKYLETGVHSLLNQTYKNIEIILVDDWSTDDSWAMCEYFAAKHSNIFAFQTERSSGGPLRGREKGIQESHGEWVTFMDCDDFVKPMYIEHLVDTTINGKYDIAVTGHSLLHEDGRVEDVIWKNFSQTSIERLKSFYKNFFLDQDFWTNPADTVGQNLVRASVAKKTDFSKYTSTIWGEDSLMALAFLDNSSKGINFVDHHDFLWRQRKGSGSHGGFSTTANKPALYKAFYDVFNKHGLLPLVSVIVPVYNVEKFLRECVDSILGQTYPNLEIILVDDKSPDESGRISDEYAEKDNRIKVVHKPKNEGLNMARATGYNMSTGQYVMFVDSDDLLTDICVESALRTLLKYSNDFVRFGVLNFKDKKDLDKKLTNLPLEKEVHLQSKKELYLTQFDQGQVLADLPMFGMTVWGCLYTRRSIEKVDWKESNYRAYEDNIWTLRYLENVSSCTYTSHVGYLYRFDDSITNGLNKSFTGNTFNGKPIGYLECWNNIWDEYRYYNKKYNVIDDDILESRIKRLFIFRASQLTKAKSWNVENNAKYLAEVVGIYQETLDDILREDNKRIISLESEVSRMSIELNSHMSIKRSVKLMLGNIRRRIKRGKE